MVAFLRGLRHWGMGRKGPIYWWNGSFPPASEREARMDDPMVRCRLGRANGTRLWGFPIPSGAPSFFPPVFPQFDASKVCA